MLQAWHVRHMLAEERCWPIKLWFDYESWSSSPGRIAAAHVEVHCLANPLFDLKLNLTSPYGPSLSRLQNTVRDMEDRVGVCTQLGSSGSQHFSETAEKSTSGARQDMASAPSPALSLRTDQWVATALSTR